jgi:hypothetical protein
MNISTTPMEPWIEISVGGEKHRHSLSPRGVRIGGEDCALRVPDSAGDALIVMGSPPRVRLEGTSTTPLLNGRVFEDATLRAGDTIQWGGAVLVYGGQAVLEELDDVSALSAPNPVSDPAPSTAPGATSGSNSNLERIGQRVAAGIAAQLGVADRAKVRLWQEAVIAGEFNADACAADLLDNGVGEQKSILERAGRFQRDLLMTSLQTGARGASRKVKRVARGGAAFLVANLIAIGVYTLILFTMLVLVRVKWGDSFSLDGMIDQMLSGIGLGKS